MPKTLLITSVVVFGLLAVFAVYFFAKNFEAPDAGQEYPIIFKIPFGLSLSEIAELAYSLGITRSKSAFAIYAVLSEMAYKLQSGAYEIKSPLSVSELMKILKNGPMEIEAVIFPGMTLKEIDDYLSGLKIISAGDLIYYAGFDRLKFQYPFLAAAKNLEGFLLPDTYRFYLDSEIDFVIVKILNNFKNQVINDLGDLIFSKKDANLTSILIIASFLEKEVPDFTDRRIVAGIIEKRLKTGIPLQIDATVIYNKCFGRFLNCPGLKESDFKLDSFYNTYYYQGLTPTPISNPSLDAIKAVLEKKDSKYWYYLSDPKTKKTIFSINLDEHNRNRVKYLLNKK